MEPLIVILAAGEGKRLYPITQRIPKGMVDIGTKSKLIDLKVESLPPEIRKVILLRKSEKFQPLEDRLRGVHGFDDSNIIYQDALINLGYMPQSFTLSTEELAYCISNFFKSSEHQRKFDPIIFVPVDTIVEGMDYLDLLEQHRRENADGTMLMKEGFMRGSNTRAYTIENERFVAAGPYLHHEWEAKGCPENIDIRLEPRQRTLTHEGTYVIGSRFSEVSLDIFRKSLLESDFTGLFRALKVVPYVKIDYWIDVRDHRNLELAIQKFGR